MDVDVSDAEGENMGHNSIASGEGDMDRGEGPEANTNENASAQDDGNDGITEPYVGMEFNSEDDAKILYDEYARRVGFSTKIGNYIRSNPEGGIVAREFVCGREGLKRRQGDKCVACLKIELNDDGDKWVVTKFVKEHTHSIVSPSKVHNLRPRRHFSGPTKATPPENYQEVGVSTSVMYVSMDEKNPASFVESNRLAKISRSASYAGRPSVRKMTLGKDAQNLLDYLKKMQGENPGFFYAIQLDGDNSMANVFWADGRSRTAYSHFGDAVTLDTMCRVNQFKVPFAPFTGVNHHGQTVLFGCAILLDFSEATFIWLFKTFLAAMNDRAPSSIITDQHRAIQTATARVLPQTRHCISKWHILREGQEKLANVCRAHPNFQLELYNCINLTETVEEFEFCWNSILDKYDLRRNNWLQSLYNTRTQWEPVYFRNSFFAAISPNHGFDESFFKGYVNQQTALPLFFRMYERALENWVEKEIEADFDTICTTPVLRTPSPMEHQAANLYTKKIFLKFQEELVETFVYTANQIDGGGSLSTFRVAKFEDNHKAYLVTLNIHEMKANCSCQMFEYSGILCRHILTVFTVTNVLTLPNHYILKRWTRNAKTGADECDGDQPVQDSFTLRYNKICKEAMKYAEEGAITLDTYNVAISSLKEGCKKISSVKKNVAKIAHPSSQTSKGGNENKTSISDMTPLLWPRQDEVTQCFNLNENGTPFQPVDDLNLPRMAPVSLHRDDGNMVVLPCLKSMTWVMEKKNLTPEKRAAVINLKLHDYSKNPSREFEVKFQLTSATLEPMLRSMASISERLSTPANRVAVINLKLQDTETTSGETDVKFQVSKDTLGAMLRSMAYIREQLASAAEPQLEPSPKKQKQ